MRRALSFGADGCRVELIPAATLERADDRGAAEHLTVTRPDGCAETFRLQDYGRVYGHPGLYEEVVQTRLGCKSPDVVAALLDAYSTGPLRVLDVAAGNGVSGAALRGYDVSYIVGVDKTEQARSASGRDYPGVYSDYRVGDINDTPAMRVVVREHDLNAVACAGAVGHFPVESLFALLPPGGYLACSFYDALGPSLDPVDDQHSPTAAFIRSEQQRGRFEVLQALKFRHRLAMNGDAIPGAAVVGKRLR